MGVLLLDTDGVLGYCGNVKPCLAQINVSLIYEVSVVMGRDAVSQRFDLTFF